jgi:hypothetical protein
MMLFTNHCQACEKRQLIFPSQVKAVLDTEAGVELLYTCWCGSEQTYLMVPAAERHELAAA